jgi:glycosyltransferase involved in cell wall biosynthesis
MLIEALSLGVPLIATDVGGNKDIVINKENGFLINRKDVNKLDVYIKKIMNNKKLKSNFRKKSIEHFKKNFSVEVISEKLDKEYSNLF